MSSLKNDIWARQYALTPNESYDEGLERVASNVASAENSPEDTRYWAHAFAGMMQRNEFLPGGRVLAGAGSEHGNVLNCFVQDGSPHQPGSTAYALALAKKLALVTKVGGGNGLNLDVFPPKRPYTGLMGSATVYINSRHTDAENVFAGRYKDLVIGEYVTRRYKAVTVTRAMLPEYTKVIEVEDSVESIWTSATMMVEGMLQGHHVFVDLSRLRAEGQPVKGSGGESSGPASFAVEIFDNFAHWAKLGGAEHAGPVATLRYVFASTLRAIRQGGTRRGAGMATLSATHPDVLDFVTAKDLNRERDEGDIGTFNISVLASASFMEAAQQSHTDDARVLRQIAQHAHATGEPGLIFVDRINQHNLLREVDGPIMATNPCGEIPLYPGEPCDLGAIVLSQHLVASPGHAPLKELDRNKLTATTHSAVRFLDNVLSIEKSPLPEIHDAILDKRRIGLGVMGLADMLIQMGLRYDSQAGRDAVEHALTQVRESATAASENLGRWRGVPAGVARGGAKRRNVALLTVAPTGTTSMLAECSSGIEPVFAAAYVRRIGTDYVPVVHPLLMQILEEHTPMGPYGDPNEGAWNWRALAEAISRHHGSIQPLVKAGLLPDDPRLNAFVVAHDIAPQGHVLMQATVQNVFDAGGQKVGNSISKTINMPHEARVEDVAEAYRLAYVLGCKGITVYRDGSRSLQVLTTGPSEPETVPEPMPEPAPALVQDQVGDEGDDVDDTDDTNDVDVPDLNHGRIPTPRGRVRALHHMVERPRVVTGSSYKFELQNKKVYAQVFRNRDGRVVEVWTPPYKGDNSKTKTMHDVIGRLASLALKYGAPASAVAQVFRGHYDESGGIARHVGHVPSQWELIAHAIEDEAQVAEASHEIASLLQDVIHVGEDDQGAYVSIDKEVLRAKTVAACPDCAAPLRFEEGCHKCASCGYSKCG
jgi:ribonucleoside-diphosphate reductase alpha chain